MGVAKKKKKQFKIHMLNSNDSLGGKLIIINRLKLSKLSLSLYCPNKLIMN